MQNNQLEVTCIKKTNHPAPYDRICGIGGVHLHNGKRWFLPSEKAIAAIESGEWQFWTMGGGKIAWLVVATYEGRKYLKTEPDPVLPNNLLSLHECP